VIRRAASVFVLVALPAATVAVIAAGLVTPGYDPVTTTISRLAIPASPAAIVVDAAIAGTGAACLALALAVTTGRPALVQAGFGFLAAALIHLDPASAMTTAVHRASSGIAVLGLAVAALQLTRVYGRLSLVLGIVEVAMLALAGALLLIPFSWWGAWERALLAVALAWMVLVATTTASTPEAAMATAAMASNTGS